MLLTAECATTEELLEDFLQVQGLSRRRLMRMPVQTESIPDFARSVAAGLEREPRRLDCRFLYDARGSELYERICEQPEYYPTRTEAAILAEHAAEISQLTGPVTLFELGSGCAVKTDHLLAAYGRQQPFLHYVPIDVSESALHQASSNLTARYPNLQVTGINGTYEDGYHLFQSASPSLVLFLGSTIGNMDSGEAAAFWQEIGSHLTTGDFFLLGADLVKEPRLLEAAYDDAAGVTASFTRNLFFRMNRELGSALQPGAIQHLARYNSRLEQIEIHARFTREQTIRVAPLERQYRIPAGDEILVEISRKFRLVNLAASLEEFGFTVRKTFTDPQEWYAVLLLQRR